MKKLKIISLPVIEINKLLGCNEDDVCNVKFENFGLEYVKNQDQRLKSHILYEVIDETKFTKTVTEKNINVTKAF